MGATAAGGVRPGTDRCGLFALELPSQPSRILVNALGYGMRSLLWPASPEGPAPFVIVRLKPITYRDSASD